jgi:hypothetical protein
MGKSCYGLPAFRLGGKPIAGFAAHAGHSPKLGPAPGPRGAARGASPSRRRGPAQGAEVDPLGGVGLEVEEKTRRGALTPRAPGP